MLQKFLLIGLGGSGGKTLRYVWKEADDRLKSEGWTAGMPQGWQFLHIDLPENPDVFGPDFPIEIAQSIDYIGLARQPFRYNHYDSQMVSTQSLDAVLGWRPDPAAHYAHPYNGAGQLRAVGRVIGLTRQQMIVDAIDRAVAKVLDSNADEEMRALGSKLHSSRELRSADQAAVIVISSLAGGSGSGLFLDVIELLGTKLAVQAPWLRNAQMSVLFGADVFADLTPGQRTGVEPNSLAAFSELLNASESGRASMHTFVIGRGNGPLRFANERSVYQAVGKTLATVMANDDVQHQFRAYIATNASGAPTNEAFTPIASEGRFSSFGYSSVSLGRTHFAQYAAERLAKATLTRLKDGWKENERGENPMEESLVKKRVDRERTGFLQACGLVLVDGQVDVKLTYAKASPPEVTKESVRERFAEIFRGLPPNEQRAGRDWIATIRQKDQNGRVAFLAERVRTVQADVDAWSDGVIAGIEKATSDAVAVHGFDIAKVLLEDLVKELATLSDGLAHKAKVEIPASRSEHTRLKADWAKQNSAADVFREALEGENAPMEYFARIFRADVGIRAHSAVQAAIDDVGNHVVGPLLAELTRARTELDDWTDPKAQGEFHKRVAQWSDAEPPSHLRAAPNERLIIEQRDHPELLDKKLEKIFPKSDPERSDAVKEIIGGYAEDESRNPERSENNRMPVLSLKPVKGRNAEVKISVSPLTLLKRADSWVRDRKGIGEFVAGTLREWLTETASEADRQRFADLFELAIQGAAPLVSVNQGAYVRLHGESPPPPKLVIGPIPLDSSDALYPRLSGALRGAGLQEGEIADRFDAQADVQRIEITSFTAVHVHPLVFDSLTLPIQADWATRDSAKERDQFWRCRRARPLREFVPMAPAQLDRLVRGWFTALVLGWIGDLKGRWSHQPLAIWTPDGTKTFPPHLLGPDVKDPVLVLPALIETMPLAMVGYGLGDTGPLDAYLALLRLGATGTSERVSRDLALWVRYGETMKGNPGHDDAPMPNASFAGPEGNSGEAAAERAENIARHLRAYGEGYKSRFDKPVGPNSTGPFAAWEIREVVLQATTLLSDAITVMATTPDSSGGGNLFAVPGA